MGIDIADIHEIDAIIVFARVLYNMGIREDNPNLEDQEVLSERDDMRAQGQDVLIHSLLAVERQEETKGKTHILVAVVPVISPSFFSIYSLRLLTTAIRKFTSDHVLD